MTGSGVPPVEGEPGEGRQPVEDPSEGRAVPAVAAVVVDYDAGELLAGCVASLRADRDVTEVVVVANGDAATARSALAGTGVPVLAPERNLGYGAGANRGVAATGDTPYLLVCNPDLRVHAGAVGRLARALDGRPTWAVVGPTILTPEGSPYPSVRRFPSMTDAVGHALLGPLLPGNRFTRRYRSPAPGAEGSVVADWVSGACMLARRSAFEELGGFDESYFMFAEDMDLCWRARQAGWDVGHEPAAVVTHVQGATTRRRPYRMLVEHHRSALRFAGRTTTGWRRAALPLATVVLGVRLVASLGGQVVADLRHLQWGRAARGSVVASRSQSQAKRPT